MTTNDKYKATFEDTSDSKYSINDIREQIKPVRNLVYLEKLKMNHEEPNNKIIVLANIEGQEQKYSIGRVIAVGPEVKDYQKDQILIFGKWSGLEMNIRGEKFAIVKEEEISAIVSL